MEMYERLTRLIRLTSVNHPGTLAHMNRDPKIPDLVDLTEAAAILGISRQAAHKRATKGQLSGATAGGTWVFRRSVVEAARNADNQDRGSAPIE